LFARGDVEEQARVLRLIERALELEERAAVVAVLVEEASGVVVGFRGPAERLGQRRGHVRRGRRGRRRSGRGGRRGGGSGGPGAEPARPAREREREPAPRAPRAGEERARKA